MHHLSWLHLLIRMHDCITPTPEFNGAKKDALNFIVYDTVSLGLSETCFKTPEIFREKKLIWRKLGR